DRGEEVTFSQPVSLKPEGFFSKSAGLAGSLHPQLATKFFQPFDLLTQIMLVQELVAKNGQSKLPLHTAQLFFDFAQFFHHEEPPRSQKMKTMSLVHGFPTVFIPPFQTNKPQKTGKILIDSIPCDKFLPFQTMGRPAPPRGFDDDSSIFACVRRQLV